ncbi:MAG: ABC transporter ATP-binding protein [Phycisphaerales bacterium]
MSGSTPGSTPGSTASSTPSSAPPAAALLDQVAADRVAAGTAEDTSAWAGVTAAASRAPEGTDVVLDLAGVSHNFGPNLVLHDIDLQIARGQITALVGPSGSGKSTLLRSILGTHPPNGGQVRIDGEFVGAPTRRSGIVYQRYTLYPFLTAVENVMFGLALEQSGPFSWLNVPKWRANRRVWREESMAMLERVGLADAAKRYPAEMSGGMCQRVAIAQTMVMKPEILLLDEPFGALDEATRESLQQMLLGFYAENLEDRSAGRPPRYTIVIVTHELNEAIYVSDRVIGLSQYWDWRAEGHAAAPGATIVYDTVAPVFTVACERDFVRFTDQREAVRRWVMDTETLQPRGEHVRFWDHVKAGTAEGILGPSSTA